MSRSEFNVIARYFNSEKLAFPSAGVKLGIGDDGAILTGTGESSLSMSMDLLIADVHFPKDASAHAIATRALSVNLSDLAAMAAKPLCFTLGLAMPNVDEVWLEQFSEGLAEIAQNYQCPLVGGDLTRCSAKAPLTIAIQVHGLHDLNKPVLRSGAKLGDDVYVTGCLGDGALALLSLGIQSHLNLTRLHPINDLTQAAKDYFSRAFYKPEPRIAIALALGDLMNAAIDISDGFAADLGHILKASKLGAVIDSESLPYSDHAMGLVSRESCIQTALFGGDDYELCFTACPKSENEIVAVASSVGVQLTKVGKIVAEPGLQVRSSNGRSLELKNQAYDHFRDLSV